jgi:hypothetical protein
VSQNIYGTLKYLIKHGIFNNWYDIEMMLFEASMNSDDSSLSFKALLNFMQRRDERFDFRR